MALRVGWVLLVFDLVNPWRGIHEPVLHLTCLHWHAHLNAVWHLCDAVWVLVCGLAAEEGIHVHATEALSV